MGAWSEALDPSVDGVGAQAQLIKDGQTLSFASLAASGHLYRVSRLHASAGMLLLFSPIAAVAMIACKDKEMSQSTDGARFKFYSPYQVQFFDCIYLVCLW